MKIAACLVAWVLMISLPAIAQPMDHSQHMPGIDKAAEQHPARSSAADSCSPEHAAMGHCILKDGLDESEHDEGEKGVNRDDPNCPPEHAAMGHCKPEVKKLTPPIGVERGGTALPSGTASAPTAPRADYADRVWGAEVMAPARSAMMKEHGGMSFSQVMLNLAEVRTGKGGDGYSWAGEAWFGGDINRLTIKSEGEGAFDGGLESAEVQVLYTRAIGPYFNLQAGVRQDIGPAPTRTFATLGFEGLAPYWFEVEGAVFLSDKADVLARLEAYYDQRITQRLVLQPRAEVNLSAQTMRAEGVGSGLVDGELGLRLRYELRREFAPYVGISWERKFGQTAHLARVVGEDRGGLRFVTGIRAWF